MQDIPKGVPILVVHGHGPPLACPSCMEGPNMKNVLSLLDCAPNLSCQSPFTGLLGIPPLAVGFPNDLFSQTRPILLPGINTFYFKL